MEIFRVKDELWMKAAVYAIRTEADVFGLGSSLQGDFKEDTDSSRYVLITEGIYPVSTCRINVLNPDTAKIERVATHPKFQGKNYGREVILAAEKWLKEEGISKIYINSRVAVVGFYEKLGYQSDPSSVTGEGTFQCIMTYKEI
ncbi:GNAT family N-acetyltransferase [Facklamia hominis]